MLKRIKVEQLTLGMHLKQFCGSWLDHPFWRTGFVITDPKDLATVLASPIKEVWIDSSKGLDVASGEAPVTTAQTEAQLAQEQHAHTQAARDTTPVSAQEEYKRAAKIVSRSKEAIVTMFQDVRMGKAVDSEAALQIVEEIGDSVRRNPNALINIARLKTADDYTYMHSMAVCAMMVALSRQMNLDEAQTRSAGLAGLLHDVGKIAMPTKVLNKPGKLTDAEFTVMRSHPVAGHKMLLESGNADPATLDVCLHHHERVDGKGYPNGLRGDQLSLFAKMGAVCDVYDAITSNRPYKTGWDPSESLRQMAEWASGGHFDNTVFQAFVKSLGIYPIGSLVRLASGRVGVVVEQTAGSLTKPLVKAFFSTKSNMRMVPVMVDLAAKGSSERIVAREEMQNWPAADINELWMGALA